MNKKACMIAHRGYSAKYPANTEPAFVGAAAHRSGGAETDIRMTADDVLVLSHDNEVRYADGSVLTVADHSYDELTAKPLKQDMIDRDVYLCSLRRYLEIMKEHNMICFIELKGVFTQAGQQRVIDTIREVYDISKCIMQSFEFDNLLRMRALWPDLPLMFTYGTESGDYKRCFEHGISIDASYLVLTDQMIADFHQHGLEVGVWTINTAERLEQVRAMDVDYIESDIYSIDDL